MDGPPPELCTIESARTMASDIVNFLSGRSIGPTTTSTTPATTTAQPPHPPYRSEPEAAPSMVALPHTPPRHGSAATVDARPPKRMLGKEYQRKNRRNQSNDHFAEA
ncbi:hypothetical protein Scep_007367 [Stephania cephalantha]|uniref:Uncharacterized protein n=1 Tax=Stephania cephalantha TaxID=152367 RepID=A0AAP0KB06_9MAGN